MLIDEEIAADGMLLRTHLELADDKLLLKDDRGLEVAIPTAWIGSVMRRYGRELDQTVTPGSPELQLGEGLALGRLDYRAAVDADSRSYLVLHLAGQPPLAALANGVVAALRHLASRR